MEIIIVFEARYGRVKSNDHVVKGSESYPK